MSHNKSLSIIIWILLTAAIACGAFFYGRSIERNAADAAANAERELNILLNRSDLEGLGDIEGKIYVAGHKSPDSDTVGSSIAYANLLQKLGYDAEAVVLGDINHETAFILQSANLEIPPLLLDASGKNMILVDHSEYSQSADGLKDAHIISIIDHHGDGKVTTGNQLIYDARPLGSTSTIVWIRYRNYGVELDRQTALVMLGSILSDTHNLQSNSVTTADREAIKDLTAMAGISDTDAFYQEMYKASLSYEGMSDEQIFFSDYKEYESGGRKYSIGCINVYDEKDAQDMAEHMKKILPATLSSTGMDLAYAQINIFHDGLDLSFLVPSDETAASVIESAFGVQTVFDGTSFVFKPGISRKQILVPAISEILASHPSE